MVQVFNSLFIVYAGLIFLTYVYIAVLSILELRKYIARNQYVDYTAMLSFERLPSITIIAPAYNEERTIVENIKCLLSLKYTDYEIIIVNDGSKDNSMQLIIEEFDLVKSNLVYNPKIKTANVRGIYVSSNKAYNHLMVVDKENGGKSDALNTGINISKKELFLAIDVDCIIEPDAMLRMVKPFIEEQEHVVIASGGVVRVANSCKIVNGRIEEIHFPKKLWAQFQVLEYFRAFTLGRMAWSKVNGLLIISGAVGLFDHKLAMAVGGYDTTTVGEDLELVVRMRRYMHEVEKKKYKVAFIPDPLCWTEVPESLKILSRQRNRWTRGAVETIRTHRAMLFNPKYGRIGLVSFPYWVFFEWLAPIIQMVGLIYVVIIAFLGMLNLKVFLIMALFILSFVLAYTYFAIFYEAYTFNKYKGVKYLSKAFFIATIEMLVYQPLNLIFSISGNIDAFFGKKNKKWGEMTRKGFESK
jgi:biofilm PGA synthesis N-glycosyltransferase PgaC